MGKYEVIPRHLHERDTIKKRYGAELSKQLKFPSNAISSTKYTFLNFIPKNLFEQFHRFANIYFVFICIINFVPQVDAISPLLSLAPVVAILAFTACKDGYEDYRRYKSDKNINSQKCTVKSGSTNISKSWDSLKVGDIINIGLNEEIPADCLLIASTNAGNICFIETANLDGETNLKQKDVVEPDFITESSFDCILHTNRPNPDLSKFVGYLTPAFNNSTQVPKHVVKNGNIMYRGCVLRNTDQVEALIVYAGRNTKAVLNNSDPPKKTSYMEQLMNRDVIWCVVILMSLCITGAIASSLWERDNSEKHWYISKQPGSSESFNTYDGVLNGFFTFLRMVVLLQILIPLSLYITIEIVKLIHVYFISNDLEMYSEDNDSGIDCRALNLTEELGNIQSIFSDKTGTLTENQMIFRAASINGINFEHTSHKRATEKQKSKAQEPVAESVAHRPKRHFRRITEDEANLKDLVASASNGTISEFDPETTVVPDPELLTQLKSFEETDPTVRDFFLCLSCCNTVVLTMEQRMKRLKDVPETPGSRTPLGTVRHSFSTLGRKVKKGALRIRRFGKPKSGTPDSGLQAVEEATRDNPSFDPEERTPVDRSCLRLNLSPVQAPSNVKFADESEYLKEKDVLYESESPDEAALVYASKGYGVTLMYRSERSIRISWPREGIKTIRCRYVLPFDSTRKMMSVILDDPDNPGGSLVLTKGADSAVFDRLKTRDFASSTREHVEHYAENGLRTLCLARRRLSQEETEQLLPEIETAEVAGDPESLDRLYKNIEHNLELLGATAIEDRLQDGVAESILALRDAQLSVWVLTGDKVQTAVEIGRSCNLIRKTDHLIYLTMDSQEAALSKFQTMKGIGTDSVLIISGANLEYILKEEKKDFIKLCDACNAVLCCRTTPKLKGDVVAAVREILNRRTLSIGDGANDVAMIQEANIGVGISGHEGRQAVMASDYAMPRFRMLPRLLLVHGHWNYKRITQLIEYFFYKNALFILLIFIYQGFSGWSGTNFIPDLYLILFMLVFNSVPPIVNATIDRFLPAKTLISKPILYQSSANNKGYQAHTFWVSILDAVYQALSQFFIPFGIYFSSNGQFSPEGTISVWTWGTIVAAGCLLATFLHLGIDTMSWTWIHPVVLTLSYCSFLVVALIFNALPSTGQNEYFTMAYLFSDLWSWLTVIATSVISVLPRLVIKVFSNTFYPTTEHYIRSCHYVQSQNLQQ